MESLDTLSGSFAYWACGCNNIVQPRFPVIGALPCSSHLPIIVAENRRPLWPHVMERSHRFISALGLVVVVRSALRSSPGHNQDTMNSIDLSISPLSQLRKTSQVQYVPSVAKGLTFPGGQRVAESLRIALIARARRF
jgi:hypothetical protein